MSETGKLRDLWGERSRQKVRDGDPPFATLRRGKGHHRQALETRALPGNRIVIESANIPGA